MPSLVVDLDNAADVENGIAILEKHRASAATADVPADPAGAAKGMIDKLFPRLGGNLRTVLEVVAAKPVGFVYTIETLADELNLPYASLRAKLNGGLRRSWVGVSRELPVAPEIFDWNWIEEEGHFEFRMKPEVREAILDRVK
jgi:hypothetical protein